MELLFLLLGFIILMLGGEMALRGTVGLARLMGVSPAVIGLTVMGLGTSAPGSVTLPNVAACTRDVTIRGMKTDEE